jgi:hypothetical protein
MIKWVKSILQGKESADLNPSNITSRYRDLLVDGNGILYVRMASGDTPIDVISAGEDDVSNGTNSTPVTNFNYLFNGSTWDRKRNNTEETVLASAARTATTNSTDFTNYNAKGAHFIIDVTAITDTPSVVVTIQGKDSVSGEYYDILESVAITATGTTILKVYPGIGAVANGSASDILPRTYRVSITHADADSITYSVGANLVI